MSKSRWIDTDPWTSQCNSTNRPAYYRVGPWNVDTGDVWSFPLLK